MSSFNMGDGAYSALGQFLARKTRPIFTNPGAPSPTPMGPISSTGSDAPVYRRSTRVPTPVPRPGQPTPYPQDFPRRPIPNTISRTRTRVPVPGSFPSGQPYYPPEYLQYLLPQLPIQQQNPLMQAALRRLQGLL